MPTDPDSTALLEALAAGDEAAWRELVDRHAPMLRGLARRILGELGEAEDGLQEIVLQLRAVAGRFRLRGTGDREGQARRWIRRVAINVCLEWRRRSRHRRPVALPPIPTEEDPALPCLRAEDRSRVYQALAELPEADRRALTLHYLEGLSQQAAAREMGCSHAALRLRLHRARRRLGRRLGGAGVLALLAPIWAELAAAEAASTAPIPLPGAAHPALPSTTILAGGPSMPLIVSLSACTVLCLGLATPLVLSAAEDREPATDPVAAEDDGEAQEGALSFTRVGEDSAWTWDVRIERRRLAEVVEAMAKAMDLDMALREGVDGDRTISYAAEATHQQTIIFDLGEEAGLEVQWPTEGGTIWFAPPREEP